MLAQEWDRTRIVIKRQTDPETIIVDILQADDRAIVQHQLRDPHLCHACCTCETAAQGNVCHHQLAVLVVLYPHTQTNAVLCRMLGTRFGYPDGCSRQSLAPLRDALDELCPMMTSTTTTRVSSQPLATTTEASGHRVRSLQSALQGFTHMCEELVETVRSAPADLEMRALDFFTSGGEQLLTRWHALNHEQMDSLQDFPRPTSHATKRIKSFMEAQKKRPAPSADVLREASALINIQPTKSDARLLISQPWGERRSALQAAAHVQACLHERAGSAAVGLGPTAAAPLASTAAPMDAVQRLLADYVKRGPVMASYYAVELRKGCNTRDDVMRVHDALCQASKSSRIYEILRNAFLALYSQPSPDNGCIALQSVDATWAVT